MTIRELKLTPYLRMKNHAHLRKKPLPKTSQRLRMMLNPRQKLKLVRKRLLLNKPFMRPRLLLRRRLLLLPKRRRHRKPKKRKLLIKLHSLSILLLTKLQQVRNLLVLMKPGPLVTLEVTCLLHNKKKRLPLKRKLKLKKRLRSIKRAKLMKKLRSNKNLKLKRKKRLKKRRKPRLKSPSLNPNLNQRVNPSQRANPRVRAKMKPSQPPRRIK